MRRRLLNIAMIGMMAFLWLVQASHCQIGAIPALKFLACASGGTADGKLHCCCGGTCKTIASRQSRTEEKKRLPAPRPESLPWLTKSLTALLLSGPNNDSQISVADVPTELPKCWQFLSRTALPVRAPSFLV